ncbi:CFA/I fimbrial minor adhesin [Klebsiella michiganensis]|nr:CFA/I fimbrial minor adhesin [Klebsiella michiganensis]
MPLAEVFINSDGVPTLGEGNADCRTQTIGSRSGLSCKMVNYNLQHNGLSNTSIHIFSGNQQLGAGFRGRKL